MISIEEIKKAREVIQDTVAHTPVVELELPNQDTNIYLKCENLQLAGSFKIRGALYRMSQLSTQEKEKGVIAWSAGNHAQGVALAAKKAGVKATICIPSLGSMSKIEATKSYGARVVLSNGNFEDAKAEAMELQKEEGLTVIHPFDDNAIIAGQGTIGLEILEQLPSVESVVVPVGGGGLISGIALAIKTLKPSCKIYGVEAESIPSMRESVSRGEPTEVVSLRTIADGIAVKKPGDLTLEYVKKYVDEIVTVTEDELAESMIYLLEKKHLLAEGAGVAAVAACLFNKVPVQQGKTLCVVSGGNVDMSLLKKVTENVLRNRGKIITIDVEIKDSPGELSKLISDIGCLKGNIVEIRHDRRSDHVSIGNCIASIDIEVKDNDHAHVLESELKQKDYILDWRN